MIKDQIMASAAISGSLPPLTENILVNIFGQSNAGGWLTGAPSESYLNDPIPRTFIWGGTEFAQLEYGVNNQANAGHGIELNLGYLLSQFTTGNIFIVKHSYPGSPIANDGTDFNWSTGGTQFSEAITKQTNAVAWLSNLGISYNYRGLWWNQGEADADVEAYANAYLTNLNDLITRFEASISDFIASKFVTVRVSSGTTLPYLSQIRTAQETKTYVNNDDLGLQADDLHSTSAAQNIMAQRFFDIIT